MNSKTKIIVLRMKELIYTGIFVALGILFLVLLFLMFRPKEDEPDTTPTSPVEESNSTEDAAAQTSYIPGVYSTALSLGSYTLNVEVVVDENNINSVRLVNLDEAVATMYPLLEPAVDSLATQICTNQSLEEISYSADNKYTIMVLLQAVKTTLEKASVQ
ncbi:MAG: hypothetical protein E7293_11150 [Lachnospiraceae bacterium]|nr:hypothetical protein [Lachnospiraceae bacterium]